MREFAKEGTEIPRGERIKKLIDILVDIADRRAAIWKGRTRIDLLVDLRENKHEVYKELINYLRKGAFYTTDEKFDELINRKKELTARRKQDGREDWEKLAEEDWEALVKEHIFRKAEVVYEKEQKIKEKEREIINKIADRVK